MTLITDTIGTTARDFSTVTLWEASLSAHAGDDVTGEMYNDSAFDESPTFDDATPTSIKLSVAAGERHDGTAGTGARFVASVGNRRFIIQTAMTLEWIDVGWPSFWGQCVYCDLYLALAGARPVVVRCISLGPRRRDWKFIRSCDLGLCSRFY